MPLAAPTMALDRESRIALRRGAVRFAACCIAGLISLLASGNPSLWQFAHGLQVACSFAAIWTMGLALGRREPVWAASFNHWDESLALNFLVLGLHVLARARF